MKKIIACQLICSALMIIVCFNCYAQTVSSTALIKEARQYDGKNISYRGEAVGDIMVRGDYAWLNVNDGANAIGVWIKEEPLKDITSIGSYRARGDVVEVTGNFNRACAEHGGDLDIHAQSLVKISSGSPTSEGLNIKTLTFAVVLFCVILPICLLRLRQR